MVERMPDRSFVAAQIEPIAYEWLLSGVCRPMPASLRRDVYQAALNTSPSKKKQGSRLPQQGETEARLETLQRKCHECRFRAHPQAEIIESLPGLGPILGTEFLVATGGDLAGFATSGRLASYAGVVPVPQDSGRVTGNLRRPKRYNRTLRRVFYMAALRSLKVNGPSRVFYDKKRGERLIHTQALLALARRLVDVLWALLRDGRRFTPTVPQPAAAAA